MSPKVSVIVPIFNVEAFIKRCVISLMEQTLDDVEFIFIDDASPDGSMDILQQVINCYPYRQFAVTILRHECNRGLPASRNTGLAAATGEYIYHCDSDDYIESDTLRQMYERAKQTDADIIYSDWFLTFNKEERYMKQPACSSPEEALRFMLNGNMKYNVWNKLIRRELYVTNDIIFPSGYSMGEDMTMIMLMAYAKKIMYLPCAFYHYVKMNMNAFSQIYSDRHLEELQYNVSLIENFIRRHFDNAFDNDLAYFKLAVKYPFLMSDSSVKYKLWTTWYPEANRHILSNKNVSVRSRFIQLCAAYGLFGIVRLHYLLIYKFIYGVIYK